MNTATPDLLPIPIPDDAAGVIRRHGLQGSLQTAYDIVLEVYGPDANPSLEIDESVEGDARNERVVFIVESAGTVEEVAAKFYRYFEISRSRLPNTDRMRIGAAGYCTVC